MEVRPSRTVEPDPAIDLSDRDELERGFARLDAGQRSILVLRFYLGLSVDEIAAALDIPSGTAKSRIHRATAAMRAALDADARLPLTDERRLA